MRKIFFLLLFVSLVGSLHASEFTHTQWEQLLKKHVAPVRGGDANQVNYAGMAKDRVLLKSYLNASSKVSSKEFDHWSKPSQLAFLINTYNAWTVELILTA